MQRRWSSVGLGCVHVTSITHAVSTAAAALQVAGVKLIPGAFRPRNHHCCSRMLDLRPGRQTSELLQGRQTCQLPDGGGPSTYLLPATSFRPDHVPATVDLSPGNVRDQHLSQTRRQVARSSAAPATHRNSGPLTHPASPRALATLLG
jgi:hypothetical protein